MRTEDFKRKLEGRPVGTIGERRKFAVMILLIERKEGLHILFERRSRRMKTQPGDVCFPGGHMEEGESPQDCALRETWEEIGIAPNQIQVLGQFDSLYGIGNITMYTFIGRVEEGALSYLKLNPDEVEQVFTVPWDFFRENPPRIYSCEILQKVDDFPYEENGIPSDYRWRRGQNPIPIYHYDCNPKDVVGEGSLHQVIWGMTGRIILWLTEQMEV